jgi:hypothetical protein
MIFLQCLSYDKNMYTYVMWQSVSAQVFIHSTHCREQIIRQAYIYTCCVIRQVDNEMSDYII